MELDALAFSLVSFPGQPSWKLGAPRVPGSVSRRQKETGQEFPAWFSIFNEKQGFASRDVPFHADPLFPSKTQTVLKNQRPHADVPGCQEGTAHTRHAFLFAREQSRHLISRAASLKILMKQHMDVIGRLFVPSILNHARDPKADLVT